MIEKELYYKEAFARNRGLLTEKEQKKLALSKIAIIGMGGVGGQHLINMVRLGVGNFHIADMDCFELVNIQRQYGASMRTLGKNKAEVMAELALSINPHLEIKVFSKGISDENINEFLEKADIVLDGIDFFSVDVRRMVFNKAREYNTYVITAGPLGFSSALLIFSPNGMSFDEYFCIRDNMSYKEKLLAFAVGLTPKALHLKYLNLGSVDLEAKKGPSLISACGLCSALAVTETVNILLERKVPLAAPHYFQFDPYTKVYKKGYLYWGGKNPLQRFKRWYLLRKLSFEDKEGVLK